MLNYTQTEIKPAFLTSHIFSQQQQQQKNPETQYQERGPLCDTLDCVVFKFLELRVMGKF